MAAAMDIISDSGRSEGSDRFPQPQPSCSGRDMPPAGAIVQRSRAALAAVLTCELCFDVFRDPWVSTLCMHTACYACFAKHWQWDGRGNKCPLCAREGVQTVWGAYPITGDPPKLQRDYTLVAALRKLFPRPDVDLEMEERDRIVVCSKPPRQTKKPAPRPPRPASAAHAAQGAAAAAQQKAQPPASYRDEYVPFLMLRLPSYMPPDCADAEAGTAAGCACNAEAASVGTAELKQPYIMAPWTATVGAIGSFVTERLRLEHLPMSSSTADLYCRGRQLQPEQTLLVVYHQFWAPQQTPMPVDQLMQLHYA